MVDNSEFDNFFSNSITTDIVVDTVDKNLLSDKIPKVLQSILDNRFQDDAKKRIILYPSNGSRINFACPYCGDSRDNSNKKRGNIYTDGLNFKCWNCSEFRDILTFISDHGKKHEFTDSELSYLKNNSIEHKISSTGSQVSTKDSFSEMSAIMNGLETLAIPREEIMSALRLKEITDNPVIFNYLKGRKQLDDESIYKKMAYDGWNEILYFFNMTKSGKVVGLQGRIQNAKRSGQRFNTKEYSKIITDVLRLPEVSDDVKIKIDRISMIYNIFHINMSKDIYIFEGSIDANHFHNSIATWSASNKIYIPNGRYFYDNTTIDKAGKDATLHMMNKSYSCFLWVKFINKHPKYRYCKDLNDIMKLEPLPLSEFNKFFGNSMLDLLYI